MLVSLLWIIVICYVAACGIYALKTYCPEGFFRIVGIGAVVIVACILLIYLLMGVMPPFAGK